MEPIQKSEEVSPDSYGYDFEDEQTRKQLELLDDLQKLGVSKYLDLPHVYAFDLFQNSGSDKFIAGSGGWSEYRQELCVASSVGDTIYCWWRNVYPLGNSDGT